MKTGRDRGNTPRCCTKSVFFKCFIFLRCSMKLINVDRYNIFICTLIVLRETVNNHCFHLNHALDLKPSFSSTFKLYCQTRFRIWIFINRIRLFLAFLLLAGSNSTSTVGSTVGTVHSWSSWKWIKCLLMIVLAQHDDTSYYGYRIRLGVNGCVI